MTIPTPNDSKRIKSNEKLSAHELNTFMDENGISVKEFAEILGVTEQAVKLWKNGNREFSITNSRLIRIFQKYPRLIREF